MGNYVFVVHCYIKGLYICKLDLKTMALYMMICCAEIYEQNCGVIYFQMDASNHKVRTYKEYHSVCPSSELGLPPTPHPQASVPPPPCFWGEGNTRWRETGLGKSQFRRGAYTVVLFICTYFVPVMKENINKRYIY